MVTWDHHTKYPLDKGRAGPQLLQYCNIICRLLSIKKLTFNEGTTSRLPTQSHWGANTTIQCNKFFGAKNILNTNCIKYPQIRLITNYIKYPLNKGHLSINIRGELTSCLTETELRYLTRRLKERKTLEFQFRELNYATKYSNFKSHALVSVN